MKASQQDDRDLKELLSEHEQLRREILHNETINAQTITATLIIVSAIMGFAFSAAVQEPLVKSALFFIAESVAIIAMFQSTDRGRLTFLIASYLRIFTEERLRHLQWETRLLEFRKLYPKEGYGEYIGNTLLTYTFLILGNFVLASLYAVQAFLNTVIFYGVIILLAIGLIITLWLLRIGQNRYTKFVYKHVDTFDSIWKKIRDKEKMSKAKR